MGKRIAIFCDGTWSGQTGEYFRKRPKTNVRLLYEAVSDAKAPGQVTQYFDGVGVGGFAIMGALTGFGLNEKILEAYRFISSLYEFGDDIYLFGFSRGAYTVRSLGGLIRTCGILRKDRLEQANAAMAIYRRRNEEGGADSKLAKAFRAEHAEAYVARGEGQERPLVQRATGARWPYALRYVGVWDTVGALGVPEVFPNAGERNAKHRFHDTELSRAVFCARHALAADERRGPFKASGWNNLPRLNEGLPAPRYQQAWFIGDHGAVGGGTGRPDLSSEALRWIAEGAAEAGLAIAPQHPNLSAPHDPLTEQIVDAASAVVDRLLSVADRDPMSEGDLVSDSARIRMERKGLAYRPWPLRPAWPPGGFWGASEEARRV